VLLPPLAALALAATGLAILAYQGISLVAATLRKYRRLYMEATALDLRELFLLFTPEDIFSVGITLALIVGLLVWLLSRNMLFASVGAVLGLLLPRMYFRHLKAKRLETFNLQLIDGLNLVANAMRAGQSLAQALRLIVREMDPPISQEFSILLREFRLGTPMDDCLRNMDKRVGSKELSLVVSAIIICKYTGGNISEVLDKISGTIRERVRLEGKIDSYTAQGRLQGYFLLAMPVVMALIFWYLAPDLWLAFAGWFWGRLILCVVILLELVAFMWIRKIVSPEV